MFNASLLGFVGILVGVSLVSVSLGLFDLGFSLGFLGRGLVRSLGGLGVGDRLVLSLDLFDRLLGVRTDSASSGSTAACGAAAAATGAAFFAAPARRARLASDVTVFSRTSSMTAIGALSPWRASTLMMRV